MPPVHPALPRGPVRSPLHDRIGSDDAALAGLRMRAPANDAAASGTVPATAGPGETPAPAAVVRPLFDATVVGLPTGLSGYELHQAVRPQRALVTGQLLAAALHAMRATVVRALAGYVRRRTARTMQETLCGLDDHTLRDIGLHRTELLGFAADTADAAGEHLRHAAFRS